MTNINKLNIIIMNKYKYIYIVSFIRTNQSPIYATYSNYNDALNDFIQQITNINNSTELNPNLLDFTNNQSYKFQITDINGKIEFINLYLSKTILDFDII